MPGLPAGIALPQESRGGQGRRIRHEVHEGARRRQRARMKQPEVAERYKKRKSIAERPFAVIKAAMDLRRFLLRGIAGAETEWLWACTAHNAEETDVDQGRAAHGGSRVEPNRRTIRNTGQIGKLVFSLVATGSRRHSLPTPSIAPIPAPEEFKLKPNPLHRQAASVGLSRQQNAALLKGRSWCRRLIESTRSCCLDRQGGAVATASNPPFGRVGLSGPGRFVVRASAFMSARHVQTCSDCRLRSLHQHGKLYVRLSRSQEKKV